MRCGEHEYSLLIGCTRNKSTNQNLEETDIQDLLPWLV